MLESLQQLYPRAGSTSLVGQALSLHKQTMVNVFYQLSSRLCHIFFKMSTWKKVECLHDLLTVTKAPICFSLCDDQRLLKHEDCHVLVPKPKPSQHQPRALSSIFATFRTLQPWAFRPSKFHSLWILCRDLPLHILMWCYSPQTSVYHNVNMEFAIDSCVRKNQSHQLVYAVCGCPKKVAIGLV